MTEAFITLGISLLIQAIFFAFAASLKTDKVTDLSYGLTFVAIALYWYLQNLDDTGIFETVLLGMVVVWAVRLSGYLLVRIFKTGRDKRFDGMRDKPLQFAKFWLLQGVGVWLIILPVVYLMNQSPSDVPVFAYVGLSIWAIGLVIETIADIQLYRFRFLKDNKGKWIDEGLWRYSRHPNYFGEILVWWGIFVYGMGVYQGAGWLTVVGPLFITILLRFISGVPILERSNDKRWGKDPDYIRYRETTNLLVLGKKSN